MRNNLAILVLLIVTFCSCGQTPKNTIHNNFNKADFALIQICVDSTLQLDHGLNTGKYLIDFSPIKTLDRQAIDSFLKINPTVIEMNLDSLMTHDTTWTKYQFFQNPVIRFDKIVRQKDGTILINTSKTRASDGSIWTEIILQKQGDNLKCLKSAITTIS